MNLLVIEPYYGGSHRQWADGYRRHASHDVQLLTLPAQAWKWRMQGGAVTLARRFAELKTQVDAILVSDMIDLSIFRALTRQLTHNIPIALYFHENQLTYPQNSRQHHGWRYGFINYASAMSADWLYFNSQYHLDVFFDTLPHMLKHFYDHNELETVNVLRSRASVLPVGLDLHRFDRFQIAKAQPAPPIILWNHRWEEDKNPEAFFQALRWLMTEQVAFRVAIVGENIRHSTPGFQQIREELGDRVVAFGYLPTVGAYAELLWQADIVVSTARQEFFGIAVAEAIYCGCVPALPDRLNYRHLIPASLHRACLYEPDEALGPLLKRHLLGQLQVPGDTLRSHIGAYDWQQVAPQYDAALRRLVPAPVLEW